MLRCQLPAAAVQEVEGAERRKLEAKLRQEAEAQLQRQRDELLQRAQRDAAAAEQKAQQAAERAAEETTIRNRCAIAVVRWPGHTTAGATHHDDMMTSITYQDDHDCQHSTSWWETIEHGLKANSELLKGWPCTYITLDP